jgi:tetratricopeptide (TPR) repeat protein
MEAREIQGRIDRAEAMAAAGDLDGSIAEYRKLLARAPALTTVYLQIGALLERKQDPVGAQAAYEQLLRIDPRNLRAQAAVARLGARN